MDNFDTTKKSVLAKLYKPDKSRKGCVDEDAIPVIDALNSKKDYYTTSSCGGRIDLFREAESKKKQESGRHFVKHEVVSHEEINEALKKLPKETVWFRQEAPIFHVACRDDAAAKRLLNICQEIGFKRSGIIGRNARVMVEIIFNDKMDVPIAKDGKLMIDERFVSFLVEKANEKFLRNRGLLARFENQIRKSL